MLRIVASNSHGDQASSFLTIDTRNKQVTVHDPAASGYATSAAHRKAAMAPKMFAFDAVFSPDDCLVCMIIVFKLIQNFAFVEQHNVNCLFKLSVALNIDSLKYNAWGVDSHRQNFY